MSGVLEGFLVIAVIVAVGLLVGRLGLLPDSATETLSRTAFFVATPALLFVTLLRADVARVLSTGLVVTALAALAVCALYVPVGMLRRRPRRRDRGRVDGQRLPQRRQPRAPDRDLRAGQRRRDRARR